jgi:uncharacterized protein (TIGR02996 family)
MKRWLAITIVSVLGGLVAGGWWWSRLPAEPAPEPPGLDLSAATPSIRHLLETHQEDLRRRPRSEVAWGAYGRALFANDRPAEAAACFRVATRLAPRDPTWPHLLGVCLRTADLEASAEAFRTAVELPAHDPASNLAYGEVLLELERPADARRILEAGIAAGGRSPGLAFLLARAEVALGDRSRGLNRAAALAEVLEFPRWDVHQFLARELASDGRDDEARRHADVLALLPDGRRVSRWFDPIADGCRSYARGINAVTAEARRQTLAGQSAAALTTLAQLRDADRDSPLVIATGALARIAAGDRVRAQADLEPALARHPSSGMLRFARGVLARAAGDLPLAVQELAEAIRLEPKDDSARLTRADCLRELGRADEAVVELKAALQLDPSNLEARMTLARLWLERGRRDDARTLLETGLPLAQRSADYRTLLDRSRSR